MSITYLLKTISSHSKSVREVIGIVSFFDRVSCKQWLGARRPRDGLVVDAQTRVHVYVCIYACMYMYIHVSPTGYWCSDEMTRATGESLR